MDAFKVSIGRACSVIGLHQSAWYYRSVKDDSSVEAKLLDLAEQYPTRGFDTYYGRLRNQGLKWNRKRVLNIVGDFNREVLWSHAAFSFPAESLVEALQEVCRDQGKPSSIRCDNGPEFISYTRKEWAKQFQIHVDYIQPGKPTRNGYVERFNRTLREDVLDAYLFTSLEEVLQNLDLWCEDYNCSHPHQSLGRIPPIQYRAMESGEAAASPHATALMTMN